MGIRVVFLWLTVIFLLGVSFLSPALASSDERILDFSSDITVSPDSSMQVTETIKVNASGDLIKHGIYRDFPTRYKDATGSIYAVGFKVLAVRRDGLDEPYRVKNIRNGVRVYIGDQKVVLPAGQYTYTLRYATKYQLGFFTDHDELYWNVTGNGWLFPITHAVATVHLPAGLDWSRVTNDGYTGYTGATGKDFQAHINDQKVTFSTTRQLAPQEGLTIVVGWPKGYVREPSGREKFLQFLVANLPVALLIGGNIIAGLYYGYIWWRVGRDPRAGTIVPQYAPPRELSPAAIRYVRRFGFDNQALTAAIINLAVKGALIIKEDKKRYTLEKTGQPSGLAPEETEILSQLFASADTLILKDKNYRTIQMAGAGAANKLGGEYKGKYFITNTLYFSIGAAASGVFLVAAGALVWQSGTVSWPFAVPVIVLVALNLAFFFLLQSATGEGRLVLDEILGFRWFLSVTEKDRLNFHNPPGITPELFERFLPYAVALDVAHEWAKQFSEAMLLAGKDPGSYAPEWYVGPLAGINGLTGLTSHLASSLNTAIAASSHPPGSSSGFGGGSAGGGGGGGGGGGW